MPAPIAGSFAPSSKAVVPKSPSMKPLSLLDQLLDVDSGETIKANCERVGEDSIVVGNRTINCTHYRIKGASETDLWFDADRQLVSRKSIEEGHRTELRLQSIKRIETAQPAMAGKPVAPKQ